MSRTSVAKPVVRLSGLRYHAEVRVAFRGESEIVSGAENGSIALWNLRSGKCIRRPRAHHRCVVSVAVSPSKRRLVTCGHDSKGKVWSLPGLEQIAALEGHAGPVFDVAWSCDGRLILSSGFSDGTVRIWNARSAKQIHCLEGGANQLRLGVSPCGKVVATGGYDSAIRLFSPTSGDNLGILHGHKMQINSLDFSPDGRLLASCSEDGAITLWDVCSKKRIRTLRSTTLSCWCVRFSRNGQFLFSTEMDGPIRAWNVTTFRKTSIARVDGNFCDLAFSPSGKLFATTTNRCDPGEIDVWEWP